MNALHRTERQPELREALRAACAPFDSASWQRVDEARGYPGSALTRRLC